MYMYLTRTDTENRSLTVTSVKWFGKVLDGKEGAMYSARTPSSTTMKKNTEKYLTLYKNNVPFPKNKLCKFTPQKDNKKPQIVESRTYPTHEKISLYNQKYKILTSCSVYAVCMPNKEISV